MNADTCDERTIAAQAERCRRLASAIVDDELRHSLEDLAEEYEEQLRDRGDDGFMLREEDDER